MPKASVKKEFVISEELNELGNRVIKERTLDIGNANVEYILIYPNINKTTAGRCMRTSMELKYFSEADYIVEMSGELWDALDESIRYVLMEHELKHIMPIMNEKSGDWNYKIRPHDIEDFSSIIKEHGADWINKVKLSISSLYDLTPTEEDSIKI